MKKIALIFGLALMLSVGLFAQTGPEVSFGYSHFTANRNGWNGGAAWNGERWGAEADIGGYYAKDGNNMYTYLFGPKFMFGKSSDDKWQPFAHLLFGSAHVTDSAFNFADSSFAWGLGIGTEYKFVDKVGGVAKLDWIRTDLNGNNDGHWRLGLGLAYHFGQ